MLLTVNMEEWAMSPQRQATPKLGKARKQDFPRASGMNIPSFKDSLNLINVGAAER